MRRSNDPGLGDVGILIVLPLKGTLEPLNLSAGQGRVVPLQMKELAMDEFDFDGGMRTSAKSAAEAAHFIEASERDMRGLGEVNAVGREALSAWRSAAHFALRVLQRYLDNKGR